MIDKQLVKDIESTLNYLMHAPTAYVKDKKKYIVEYMKIVKQRIIEDISNQKNIAELFNKTIKKLRETDGL